MRNKVRGGWEKPDFKHVPLGAEVTAYVTAANSKPL